VPDERLPALLNGLYPQKKLNVLYIPNSVVTPDRHINLAGTTMAAISIGQNRISICLRVSLFIFFEMK